MPKVVLSSGFVKSYQELQKDNPGIKKVVDQRVIWFRRKPNDTRLDNHTLTKKMTGKWAFSITDDIRIVYEWLSNSTVRFQEIGPHDKVYIKRKQSPKR